MLDSPVINAPVRIAGPGDEDAVCVTLRLMHAETAFFTLNESKMLDAVQSGTRQRGGIVGVIDGDNGTVAATVGLIISSTWYTDEACLNDMWMFVRTEHRQTSYANDLIDFAIGMSEQLGIPLQMGITSPVRLAAKTRLLRRRLMPIGALFGHNLRNLNVGGAR